MSNCKFTQSGTAIIVGLSPSKRMLVDLQRNSSNSRQRQLECLLCLTEFDSEDHRFRPCQCSYKICRFCWFRIYYGATRRCPGCRSLLSASSLRDLSPTCLLRSVHCLRSNRNGSFAFVILSMLAFFNSSVDIPIRIFGAPQKVFKLLELHHFITLDTNEEMPSFRIGNAIQMTMRRVVETEPTLRSCMEQLETILGQNTIQNCRKREKDRVHWVHAYLPHGLSVWYHFLNENAGDISASASLFFTSICDRLDECQLHLQFLEIVRASFPAIIRTHGPSHLRTIRAKADFGTALWRTGHLMESLDILNEVLTTAIPLFGERHWLILNTLNEMAFIQNRNGNVDEAIRISTKLSFLMKLEFGETHFDTLTILRNKGILLFRAKRIQESLQTMRQTQDLQRRAYGESHPSTLATENWIGRIQMETGDIAGSLETFKELLRKEEACDEPNEMLILDVSAIVIRLLGKGRKLNDALSFSHKLSLRLCDLSAVPASTHDELECLLHLLIKCKLETAICLFALGSTTEAMEILETLYTMRLELLGENHEDTSSLLQQIESCRSLI